MREGITLEFGKFVISLMNVPWPFFPMGALPGFAGWVPTADVTGSQRLAPHTHLSVPSHLLLRLALALA